MATILVMDDDPFVRDVIARMLKMEGHRVLIFPDARPALEEVNFDETDLIITDLTMATPGETAIRALRHRGVDVPILVLSGYIDSQKAEYLFALGAQRVMAKPFLLKALMAQVQELLNEKAPE